MSDGDEAKEVQRLSTALDAAHDWQSEEKLTQELAFLVGDTSARERCGAFSFSGPIRNYYQNIDLGLYISRNRALVFQLLEAACAMRASQ